MYEGEYKDGKRDGRGMSTDADRGIYDGEWKVDKRHGVGTYTDGQGNVIYQGRWVDGALNWAEKLYKTEDRLSFYNVLGEERRPTEFIHKLAHISCMSSVGTQVCGFRMAAIRRNEEVVDNEKNKQSERQEEWTYLLSDYRMLLEAITGRIAYDGFTKVCKTFVLIKTLQLQQHTEGKWNMGMGQISNIISILLNFASFGLLFLDIFEVRKFNNKEFRYWCEKKDFIEVSKTGTPGKELVKRGNLDAQGRDFNPSVVQFRIAWGILVLFILYFTVDFCAGFVCPESLWEFGCIDTSQIVE
jgi:hypothetical protein